MARTSRLETCQAQPPRPGEARLPWAWLTRTALLRGVGGFVALVLVGLVTAAALAAITPDWASAPSGEVTGISPRAEALDVDGGGLDARVTASVHEAAAPWQVGVAQVVSHLAKIWFVFGLIVVVGAAAWWRSRRTAVFWVPLAAVVGGFALSVAVKMTVFRPRPPEDVAAVEAFGPAFPSGHAIRAVAVYGAYAWLVAAATRSARVRAAAWTVAAAITAVVGVARIIEGAHWLSDVLASFVLGSAWLVVVLWSSDLLPRRARDDPRVVEVRSA